MSKREGVNYPKFKDQFAAMDFEADPLPVLSLFPMPARRALEEWELVLTDVDGRLARIGWADIERLPRVRARTPLVCQIFNWWEEPAIEGVRLVDVLQAAEIDAPSRGHFAFYSADGLYFEGLPRSMAWDPRVLLVFGIEGGPLPHELGGPVRLWVPFLQGYKSVKWLHQARAFRRDPIGIKRLLGQSRTAVLGGDGQEHAGVVVAKVSSGEAGEDI